MLKKRLGIEAIERDWSNGCINWYFKVPTTIIIPEIIEKIGSWSFGMCPWLKKVTIPESVKIIGTGAFYDCRKLEKVITSEGILWISTNSFRDCESLKKVVIPRSVEKIGDWAFWGCDNAEIILKKAKSEFKEIGYQAFGDCKYVKEETGD